VIHIRGDIRLAPADRWDPSDNAAGFAIHGAIHKLRPDIHAAAHSHTTYGRAFSVLGRNLDMASHGKFAHSD
jgi:ribulose-5-phosphate 4-epimerase/fuculose-1-phosphate aldolase